MASLGFILRSDVYVGNSHQCDRLRQIARDWNWDHAKETSTPDSLADEAAELLRMSDFWDDDGNKIEPSEDGILFLRGCLVGAAEKALGPYEIQTMRRGSWFSDGLGEQNEFATVGEAEAAIDELRKLGDDWANAEYRVARVKS